MHTWRQVLYAQVQVQVLTPQVQVRVQVLQNCTRVQVQVQSIILHLWFGLDTNITIYCTIPE